MADIPASMLTRLHYAFANVVNGKAVLGDPVADIQNFIKLKALKQSHPKLMILLSVGGWSWSSGFSDAVLTATSRQIFAASCISLMVTNGFDGLDIDWEYPVSGGHSSNITRPEDKRNFTFFMAELRRQLNLEAARQKRTLLLTMTAPANPNVIKNIEVAKIQAHVDSMGVMAYSFHGPWAPRRDLTGLSAALYPDPNSLFPEPAKSKYNVDAVITAYLSAGVPHAKLILGLTFQGVGFAGVFGSANGLYGVYTGAPPGTWSPGYFDYTDLDQNYIDKNGYKRYWHNDARAPWLYNPTAQVMITYEDPRSIREKAWYARSAGLGGIMSWELSADRKKSLLSVVGAEMTKVPGLRAPVRKISVSQPSRIDMFIESNASRAGHQYFALGSLSGTTPGFKVANGVLPLNFDVMMMISIWWANGPLLPGTIGTLDINGSARAGFNSAALGKTLPASLIGLRVNFAAWIAQSPPNLNGEATNPIDVFLTP